MLPVMLGLTSAISGWKHDMHDVLTLVHTGAGGSFVVIAGGAVVPATVLVKFSSVVVVVVVKVLQGSVHSVYPGVLVSSGLVVFAIDWFPDMLSASVTFRIYTGSVVGSRVDRADVVVSSIVVEASVVVKTSVVK